MKAMMSVFLLGLMFTSFSALADRQLSDVVLGYDLTADTDENPYFFPCSQYAGVMFCNTVTIQDAACAKSISVAGSTKQAAISCRTSKGEFIVLAQTNPSADFVIDRTQDGMGFYYLIFNPRVKLNNVGKKSILVIK